MSDEEPTETFAVNLCDPRLALFASSVELIIKRVVVVNNVFICFNFHVVTIPHFHRKSKLYFVFLSLFFRGRVFSEFLTFYLTAAARGGGEFYKQEAFHSVIRAKKNIHVIQV